jgi:hypothetical protein
MLNLVLTLGLAAQESMVVETGFEQDAVPEMMLRSGTLMHFR